MSEKKLLTANNVETAYKKEEVEAFNQKQAKLNAMREAVKSEPKENIVKEASK